MRNSFRIFFLVFLIVFFIEVGLHMANSKLGLDKREERPEDKKFLLSPYSGKRWAKDLFEETDSIQTSYDPFVGWRRRSFSGRYVNLDAEGIRKTWSPSNANSQEDKKIYIFGGSAIWGHGSRDDYTIPSHLAKMLEEDGYKFSVYNYGELAYVFTQEVFYLALFLFLKFVLTVLFCLLHFLDFVYFLLLQ